MQDKRIKEYRYLEQLREYVSSAEEHEINGQKYIYPRQLEIHLPSKCNAHCKHCFGTLYKKDLGKWEYKGLELLHNLKGVIPYHIYGGAYTEPTLNSYLYRYLDVTKTYGNHFGIHTNGIKLNTPFLNFIHNISTDNIDYLSISLDAGSGISWSELKQVNPYRYWEILGSIEQAANIRDKFGKSHAIRIVCLMTKVVPEEIEFLVSFVKMLKIDSLRFSIPYDYYNKSFEEVKNYKFYIENSLEQQFKSMLEPYISKSEDEKPYIFWNPPWFTDIERFTFDKCYYGLFQITLGADGYVYPCSAVASPTAEHLRYGEITSDINEFQKQIANIQKGIDVKKMCFEKGLRCNRMGLEINSYWR
jgi:MoaA/NifB/PqqE/SkfB family radical SAM enzyme